MIELKIKTDFDPAKVLVPAKKAAFKNVSHAAASIRKTEIASFIPSDVASPPGTPPHTRKRVVKRGKNKGKLRVGQIARAVAFDVPPDVSREPAVIGPRKAIVGTSAKAHEFGGSYKGNVYPPRPFALPALQANVDRFGESFAGSVGS